MVDPSVSAVWGQCLGLMADENVPAGIVFLEPCHARYSRSWSGRYSGKEDRTILGGSVSEVTVTVRFP